MTIDDGRLTDHVTCHPTRRHVTPLAPPAPFPYPSIVTTNSISTRLSQSLDPSRADGIVSQIVDTIWQDVIDGSLETGELLPTVRELSVDLGMSPRAIERSYERLEQLGVLTSQPGGGTVVSLRAADPAQRARWKELETICRNVADQAQSLGFTLDDVMDVLTGLRSHHT